MKKEERITTMSIIYKAIRGSLGLDEKEAMNCNITLDELIKNSGCKIRAGYGELMDIINRIGVNPSILKGLFDPHKITEPGKRVLSGLASHLGATPKEYFDMITKDGDDHYIGNFRPLEFLYLKHYLTK